MDKLIQSGSTLEGFVIFIIVIHVIKGQKDCGGYIYAVPGDSGTIHSPNYPNKYGANQNCIWLLKAKTAFNIELTVAGVAGEQQGVPDEGGATVCLDFVEVRNGSSVQPVMYYECSTVQYETLTARWIWVRFASSAVNHSTGFEATWRVITDPAGTGDTTGPIQDCPMEFTCPNKECVPRAYKCDGYNDCGYSSHSSDEHNCDGLGLSAETKLAIGIGSGTGFFIIIFFGIGLLDICLKKRTERKYKERMELHKKLLKQKKAKAMASLLVAQPSVPGSGSGSVSENTGSLKLATSNLDASFTSNGTVPASPHV